MIISQIKNKVDLNLKDKSWTEALTDPKVTLTIIDRIKMILIHNQIKI